MDIGAEILLNPAIQAVAIKVLTDVVHKKLKGLDESDAVDKYSGYVKGGVALLTGLVAFATLALQHQAANFDSQPFVQYLVTLIGASYGAHSLPKTFEKK